MSDLLNLVRSASGHLKATTSGPLGPILARAVGVEPGQTVPVRLDVKPTKRGYQWTRSLDGQTRTTLVWNLDQTIVESAGPFQLRFTQEQAAPNRIKLTLPPAIRRLLTVDIDVERVGRRVRTDVDVSLLGGRVGHLAYQAWMIDNDREMA